MTIELPEDPFCHVPVGLNLIGACKIGRHRKGTRGGEKPETREIRSIVVWSYTAFGLGWESILKPTQVRSFAVDDAPQNSTEPQRQI